MPKGRLTDYLMSDEYASPEEANMAWLLSTGGESAKPGLLRPKALSLPKTPKLPDISGPSVEGPSVEAPSAPELKLPDIDVAAPKIDVPIPDVKVDVPKVDVSLDPGINLPEINLGQSPSIPMPSVGIGGVDLSKINIPTPELGLGGIDLSKLLPDINLGQDKIPLPSSGGLGYNPSTGEVSYNPSIEQIIKTIGDVAGIAGQEGLQSAIGTIGSTLGNISGAVAPFVPVITATKQYLDAVKNIEAHGEKYNQMSDYYGTGSGYEGAPEKLMAYGTYGDRLLKDYANINGLDYNNVRNGRSQGLLNVENFMESAYDKSKQYNLDFYGFDPKTLMDNYYKRLDTKAAQLSRGGDGYSLQHAKEFMNNTWGDIFTYTTNEMKSKIDYLKKPPTVRGKVTTGGY